MEEVNIRVEDINTKDAKNLIDELSEELRNITGCDGRESFNNEDMLNKRSIFSVVRDKEGKALGCGALRYCSDDTAEIKRMYVRKKSCGIGSKLLSFLENKAKELKYKRVILETRVVNRGAVKFYRQNKYGRIKNYGRYVNMNDAICLEKVISC